MTATDAVKVDVYELERRIEALRVERETPGVAVLLVRDGEPLLARGFGHRDRKAGLAPDIDTVFGAGSIAKSFTALSALLLAEDGRLGIHDPVTAYLPALRLPGGGEDVTLHHLATHRAGLPPLPSRHYAWLSQDDLEPFEREYLARETAPHPQHEPLRSYDDLIAFLGEHAYALHGAPGERFSYSNESFNLLGAVVERVSGRPFAAFVQERILEPCGMTRSSFDLAYTRQLDNVTRLYTQNGGDVVASDNWFNPAAWLPAGGLRTCVRDLVRYYTMLQNRGAGERGRVAAEATVAAMTAPQVSIGEDRAYGYGLQITDSPFGVQFVHHGGGHKAVAAMAGFVRGRGVVCAVQTNLGQAPGPEIWRGCVNMALGFAFDDPVRPTWERTYTTTELSEFAGEYPSAEGSGAVVAVEDGGLVARLGTESTRLTPTGPDRFRGEGNSRLTEFRFERRDGTVTHLFMGLRLLAKAS